MNTFFLQTVYEMDPYGPFGTFLTYLYLFILGATIGYCLEVLFRRFVSMKKWINPGFLKGPCLPLYGFGVCILYFMSDMFLSYCTDPATIPSYYGLSEISSNGALPYWASALICVLLTGLLVTAVEYLAGLIFIKGLHIKLWDYSKMKGNIQGIICPLFSLIWLAVAAIYFFGLHPFIEGAVFFLIQHMWGFTFLIGAYYALFAVDFVNSVKISISMSKGAKELNSIIDYEKYKLVLRRNKKDEKKMNSAVASFMENLKEASEPLRNRLSEAATSIKAHMYINNEIPDVDPAKSNFTPHTKPSEEKKEEEK